jgi:hypothetical protein
MNENSIPAVWLEAALDGGLAGDQATALLAIRDQFHTPEALRNVALKVKGVPASQIAATVRALASTDEMVGRCVKKLTPTLQEQRADITHRDGKPRLPLFESLPETHLPPIGQEIAQYAERNAFTQSNHGMNSTNALRGTTKN